MADDVRAAGRRAVVVQADTGREADILRLFETAEAELGYIDALVNNAGISGGHSLIENVTAETLDEVLRINVAGYFLCAREAIRRMSTARGGRGGLIVNVSSIASVVSGAFDWVHYGASKAAVDTFTKGLALETAGQGIRCNSVRPGMVETDIHWPGPHREDRPDGPLEAHRLPRGGGRGGDVAPLRPRELLHRLPRRRDRRPRLSTSERDGDFLAAVGGMGEGVLAIHLERFPQNLRQRIEQLRAGSFLGIHPRNLRDPSDSTTLRPGR